MAVPGNVLSGRNRGGHALIRDGAKIVECADDIVEELGLAPAAPARGARHASGAELNDFQRSAAAAMEAGQAYDLDALAGAVGPRTASGCCRVCSTSNCRDACAASRAAVSCGPI